MSHKWHIRAFLGFGFGRSAGSVCGFRMDPTGGLVLAYDYSMTTYTTITICYIKNIIVIILVNCYTTVYITVI